MPTTIAPRRRQTSLDRVKPPTLNPRRPTCLSPTWRTISASTWASGRDVHPGDDLALLPLVADTTGKRRTIWDAWDTKGGRCGHWGALHRAAIAIRAADLDTYQQPYRRPLPITHEQRQVPGAARGVIEWVSVDPEEPGPVYPIDPVRRPTGRGVAV